MINADFVSLFCFGFQLSGFYCICIHSVFIIHTNLNKTNMRHGYIDNHCHYHNLHRHVYTSGLNIPAFRKVPEGPHDLYAAAISSYLSRTSTLNVPCIRAFGLHWMVVVLVDDLLGKANTSSLVRGAPATFAAAMASRSASSECMPAYVYMYMCVNLIIYSSPHIRIMVLHVSQYRHAESAKTQ